MSKLVERKGNSKNLIEINECFLKGSDMLRHLKLEIEIKIKTKSDVFPCK